MVIGTTLPFMPNTLPNTKKVKKRVPVMKTIRFANIKTDNEIKLLERWMSLRSPTAMIIN